MVKLDLLGTGTCGHRWWLFKVIVIFSFKFTFTILQLYLADGGSRLINDYPLMHLTTTAPIRELLGQGQVHLEQGQGGGLPEAHASDVIRLHPVTWPFNLSKTSHFVSDASPNAYKLACIRRRMSRSRSDRLLIIPGQKLWMAVSVSINLSIHPLCALPSSDDRRTRSCYSGTGTWRCRSTHGRLIHATQHPSRTCRRQRASSRAWTSERRCSSGSSTLHLDSLLGEIIIDSSIDNKRAGISIKEMVIVQV